MIHLLKCQVCRALGWDPREKYCLECGYEET